MKTERMQTVYVCDECGEDAGYPYTCFRCGKEWCFECGKQKEGTVVYGWGNALPEAVWCKECDVLLQRDRSDSLHAAYQRYDAVGAEMDAAWQEWIAKQQQIAHEIETLHEQRESKRRR